MQSNARFFRSAAMKWGQTAVPKNTPDGQEGYFRACAFSFFFSHCHCRPKAIGRPTGDPDACTRRAAVEEVACVYLDGLRAGHSRLEFFFAALKHCQFVAVSQRSCSCLLRLTQQRQVMAATICFETALSCPGGNLPQIGYGGDGACDWWQCLPVGRDQNRGGQCSSWDPRGNAMACAP